MTQPPTSLSREQGTRSTMPARSARWMAAILFAGLYEAHAAPLPQSPMRFASQTERLALIRLRPSANPQAGHPDQMEIRGVPRLGIPSLRIDGIASRPDDGLDPAALAASWDLILAHRTGTFQARAGRERGAALLVTGMLSLAPSTHAFDGISEDPLLAGMLAAELAQAMTDAHVVPILGAAPTLSASAAPGMAPSSATMADGALLAVAIATATHPYAAILCPWMPSAAGRLCETPDLFIPVFRDALHLGGALIAADNAIADPTNAFHAGIDAAAAGTDALDDKPFGKALDQAIASGHLASPALDSAAQHMMHSLLAVGATEHPPPFQASRPEQVARPASRTKAALLEDIAEESAVLLRHENGALPLTDSRLVVMHDQATPVEEADALAHAIAEASPSIATETALLEAPPREHTRHFGHVVLLLSAPVTQDAIRALSQRSDSVIVLGLERTGGMDMPWASDVDAIIEAWSWSASSAQALARLLTGQRDFSGRLPSTWPATDSQRNAGLSYHDADRTHASPLFPFGFGLSARTRFAYTDMKIVHQFPHPSVTFTATNTGKMPGDDVPQLYVALPAGIRSSPKRLLGWRRISLAPGESARVTIEIPARMLALWNDDTKTYSVRPGLYTLCVGGHSANLTLFLPWRLPATPIDDPVPPGQLPRATQ